MSQAVSTFAFLFPGNAMVNSLLATSYISIIPNLLLYFVPPDIKPTTLNTLVNFAVGKDEESMAASTRMSDSCT